MSFQQFEESRTKGERIFLYRFFDVDNAEYCYTNYEFEVEHGGKTYIPVPITNGSITSSGTLDKSGLEVRLSLRADLAEKFRVYPPSGVVNLIIRRMHVDDPDAQANVCWVGRVLSSSRGNNEMTLSCEPISTSLRRTGLRRHYQLGCPHVLYGTQCAAVKSTATIEDIAVVSVNGSTVTLPPTWIPVDWPSSRASPEKFIGGMMVWTYDTEYGPVETKRTILRINANVNVMLTGPGIGLSPGSLVNMVLGCNHQISDCVNVHSNGRNFGGCPDIPQKNPHGFTNQFY